MTTKTTDAPFQINTNKLVATALQAFSLLTTYWLVAWLMTPKTQADYTLAFTIALGGELVLIKAKSFLFDSKASNDAIGWIGFVIDTATNAGGITPRAARLVTWPPLAAMIGAFGGDATTTQTQQIGALIIGLVAGAVLSFVPHRLWHAEE